MKKRAEKMFEYGTFVFWTHFTTDIFTNYTYMKHFLVHKFIARWYKNVSCM